MSTPNSTFQTVPFSWETCSTMSLSNFTNQNCLEFNVNSHMDHIKFEAPICPRTFRKFNSILSLGFYQNYFNLSYSNLNTVKSLSIIPGNLFSALPNSGKLLEMGNRLKKMALFFNTAKVKNY